MKSPKKALLFANGKVHKYERGKICDEQFDWIIAANGGVFNALKLNFRPHYIIGDFDSVARKLKAQMSDAKFIHRPSQKTNDLEKSLVFCNELGVTDITLLGACGKRLDHTLNNLSVLSRYDRTFIFTIYYDRSQIFLVRDKWSYSGKPKQLISLIPLSRVEGVVTKGLAFPLKNEPLVFGKREGLSNYITANNVSIKISKGLLFVFVLDAKS